MDQASSRGSAGSQEGSIQDKSDASKRIPRSKVAVELHFLPTDVLRDILSWLSLKQDVRMSVLSREWRRLGICHPDLVFTKDTLFGSNTITRTDPESTITEFITRVDNVLRPLWSTSTTTTTTVDKFVVKFGLSWHQTHHIDRWINFSTASMAKHIGLDLTGRSVCEDEKYGVPLCQLSGPNGSCVESLHMADVCLKLPPSFRGITNLKKLILHSVSVDARNLECLLLSCDLLESLSFDFCPLYSFYIRQELCRLQYLSVRECLLETIQLQAPNLKTFEFSDCLTQIVLSESSNLSEAKFVFKSSSSYNWCVDAFDYILTELPTALPYVHKLFLHLVVEYKVQDFSKAHTRFINLSHLNLNIDITEDQDDATWVTRLVYFLELAPLLEELELHIACNRSGAPVPARVLTAVPAPLHRHLRSVHITGFSDLTGIAELALYILEKGTVLQRMVVDPVVRMDYRYPFVGQFYSVSKAGSSKELSQPSFTEQELHDREFARKHLDREEFRHVLTIL